MVISYRDGAKLIGIIIITFCASVISSLFLNYNMDLSISKSSLIQQGLKDIYLMLKNTGIMITIVCGCCILITTGIMLIFYIKNYIDQHRKEFGILKALGYTNLQIASRFWVFAICVFIGTCLGYIAAAIYMPRFYEIQNNEGYLPVINNEIHLEIMLLVVVMPTLLFSLFSILYSFIKLNTPAITLLQGSCAAKRYRQEKSSSISHKPFLLDMRTATLKSRRILVFLVGFSAFVYSAVIQTAYGIKNLTSETFAIMMVIIGMILSIVTIFLSLNSVVYANAKSISLMSMMGYSWKECCKMILGGYRKYSYLGFICGTIYQYALIKISLKIIFTNELPKFDFNALSFALTLFMYILIYETIQKYQANKIKKSCMKRVMLE